MNFPRHLSVVEWTHSFVNGYGLDKVAMFNETVISEELVKKLILEGTLDFEHHPKVVTMTKEQYNNLYDLGEVN